MLIYPMIHPVAFHLGPLPVHWYGLMYLLGLSVAWVLLTRRSRTVSNKFQQDALADILFYAALGIIIGGRLGYVLFYDFTLLMQAPWQIFAIWQGGMSFHGGLLGVIIAIACYARKTGHSFIELTDLIAPVVPIGLGAGRIGNFINGELWGRVTDVPWAMIFPNGGDWPRHPSQLYEFLLEGVLLFLVLWVFSRTERPRGAVSAWFLLLYGMIRFGIEFFREPDIQIGYIAWGWMSKGQLLSLPMIILGAGILVWAHRNKRKAVCSNT